MASPDPYTTLGVTPGSTDEELRTAYRRLVQLHHPDHNNGSHESALRFAEVQEAYAHVKLLRKQQTTRASSSAPSADPAVEARLAAMEQELRAARGQRERAARAAQEAARAAAQEAARAADQEAARAAARQTRASASGDTNQQAGRQEEGRATDEELGYYTTDDSFSKILDDFADQVSARFSEVHPPQQGSGTTKRTPRSVADWIDEIGSRLTGDPHTPKKDD